MKSSAADMLMPNAPAEDCAILLIGYGNLLRSDDGVGAAVVSRLAAAFLDNPRCQCLTPHQLTPELAADLRNTERVVFVDASVSVPAGKIRIRPVSAEGSEGGSSVLAHRVSPESIMALARGLFGVAPRAWCVAIGVANIAVGDRLSPAVSRTVSRLSRHLAHRVRKWSALKSKAQPTACSHASKEGSHVRS